METLTTIILETYTIALPIVLGYIIWLLKRQKKDKDANARGTMLLLRVELIEYHDKYTEQGSIPSYAYENFSEMYGAYKDLGGNGMVKKMYADVQELPIRKSTKDGEDYDQRVVEGSSNQGN